MGDTPHKPLPKLRTFKLDQAHARGEESIPVTNAVVEKKDKPSTSPLPKIVVAATKKPELKVDSKVKEPTATAAHKLPKIVIATTKKPAVKEETKAKTVPTPTTPPVPPAFHELKKNPHKKVDHLVAEPVTSKAKTVMVRDKAQATLPRSFSSEASVITSSKKGEFKLFESILAEFKAWVANLGKDNSSPKYTVSTVERRKGLIQKATTRSGAAFTTDNNSIRGEITRKRAIEIEEATHPNHLNWTPNTEPGYPLLEEKGGRISFPLPKSVVVEYKKKSLPKPTIVVPRVKAPEPQEQLFFEPQTPTEYPVYGQDTEAAPIIDPQQLPLAQSAESARPSTPVFRVPENIQLSQTATPTSPALQTAYPAPSLTVSTALPNSQRLTKPGTTIPNKPNPKTSYLHRGLKELFRFDTTVATVILVGSIFSFVMVFMVIKTFVGIIAPSKNVSEQTLSLATPLTPSGKVIDVAISSLSVDALLSAVENQSRPSTGVVEFRIIAANSTPLTGSQLWEMLEFSSNPNLSRSITDAHLGYSESENILILKVTDAVTVFGALLLWEPVMAEELAPIFSEDVQTITSVEDVNIGESDLRIIKSNGETILVYGFIDQNTVVITKSIEAYEATLGSI